MGINTNWQVHKHLMKNHLPKAKQCKWLMQMKPTLGQCGLTLNSSHSHDLDSKESHHPPPYRILCDWKCKQHWDE
jgi:hypothetical protein